MGSLAPIVMSMTTFAGSAQFAAASVLDVGRHGRRRGHGGGAAERPLRTDRGERGAVADRERGGRGSCTHSSRSTSAGRSPPRATAGSTPGCCSGAGVTFYVAWVGGTMLGVAFGDVIGDPVDVGARRRVPGVVPGAARAPAATDRRAKRGRDPRRGASRWCSRRSRRPACRSSPPAAACLLGLLDRPTVAPTRGRDVSDDLDRGGRRRGGDDRHQGARTDAARREAAPPSGSRASWRCSRPPCSPRWSR